MGERAPYSRIYWTVRSDDRLASIYPDDRHLATWVRLLIAADMAWPAPADVPGTARRASLAALEAAGVIELLPGGLFRFHGLDTERGRRADAARTSSGYRPVPERLPNGDRPVPGRDPLGDLAEKRRDRDETSRDETGGNGSYPDGDLDSQDRYYQLTGYRPWGIWSGEKLLAAERDYGRAETIAALETEWTASPDRKTILDRLLARLARAADLEKQAKKSRPRPSRPSPRDVEAAYVESQRLQAELIAGIAAVKDVP